MKKLVFVFFSFLMFLGNAKAQGEFVTVWDLSLGYANFQNQINFMATIATGGANYTWESILPSGASGSGVLSAGTSYRTISGMPTGSKVRLRITPLNLQRFYSFDGLTALRLVDVEQWGHANWTSMQDAFYGCANLNNISATDIPNLTSVNNMSSMFRGCSTLNSVSSIALWDVSNVTDMSSMFLSATSFNQSLNNWNTTSVTNMNFMFRQASAFNQPLNNWNTSSVNQMNQMFYSASAFNQPLNNWNVSSVTKMDFMFSDAIAFNQNIGSWALNPSVTLDYMLNNSGLDCHKYSSTLIGWAQNNPNVTNRNLGAVGIHFGLSAIPARNQLISQGWNIHDAGIGGVCAPFATIWNLSNSGSGANQITFNATIATGGANFTWETIPAGTSGNGTLAAGTSLRTISGIPAGATIRLSIEPQNLQRFFFNNGVDMERIVDIEQWGAAPWTSMQNAFFGCSNLNISATDIPNLSGVSNMASMFRNCFSLNGPSNIGQWNVSTVSDMQQMFRAATSFNQDVSTWNVSNVLNMFAMFRTASSFNQNLGPWTMSNAVNLVAILEGAGMDCENYSNTLIGWAANNPTALNRTLDAQGIEYGIHAMNARNMLVNFQGWTINDGGMTPCGGEFITKWNLSNPGTGANQITFNATVATGGTNFYWETIPAGTSGSGTLAEGTSFRTITGIPAGATIRLYIVGGNLQRFNISNTNNRLRLVDVEAWGNAVWTSMENAFQGCNNLAVSATDLPNLNGVSNYTNMFMDCSILNGPANISSWNMSTAINLHGMFRNAFAFNQNISSWNVSNVTDMSFLFSGNQTPMAFNQPIGSWNVGSVINMSHMFEKNVNFNQNLSNWNTAAAQDMSGMFESCTIFNSNISTWNTSSVTNMSGMFLSASAFNQPIGSWNTTNVQNMQATFANCINFNQPLNNWDVSNVNDMSTMFYNAQIFNQPLNNWDVSSVTNAQAMFYSALAFNQPLNNWDVSNFLIADGMFNSAIAFNQPLNNWNVSNIIYMGSMFEFATSFNQSLGSWTLNPNNNLSWMLNNSGLDCDNYSATLIGWAQNNPTVTNKGLGATGLAHKPIALAARNQLLAQGWTINDAGMTGPCNAFNTVWNMSNSGSGANQITFNATVATGGANFTWETIPAGTSGSGTLAAGTSLRTISGIPAGATIRLSIEPQNLQRFFFNNVGDKDRIIDVEQWGGVLWTSMESAFYGCSNLDISSTDIPVLSGVSSMANMFRNCFSLNGPANIGQWNVSTVSDMQQMFRAATSFNQDVSTWNVSSLLTMLGMFRTASSFNQNLGPWTMSNAVNLVAILEGAGMDCENYSNTLIGWAANNPTALNRTLDAQGQSYGVKGAAARSILINNQGWTINDAGFDACGGEFVTIWNLANPGSAPGQISFNAQIATGGGHYYWETIPAGNSGSGTLTAGNSNRTISGIPDGASIRLYLDSDHLQWFYFGGNHPDRLRIVNLESWSSANWTSMQNMFHQCQSLVITATDVPNLSGVSSLESMFENMDLSQGIPNIENWNTSTITNMTRTFAFSNFNQNISNWDVSNVSTMHEMFSCAKFFNQPIGNWNVNNVVDFRRMFESTCGTPNTFNQNLGSWVFRSNANLDRMINRSGMNCENYTNTPHASKDLQSFAGSEKHPAKQLDFFNFSLLFTMQKGVKHTIKTNSAYYLTLTVVDWVDVFTRKSHRDAVIESFKYCQKDKGLIIYAYCIMSNHIHLIANTDEPFHLSDVMRDFKKFTAKNIIAQIQNEPESRREWMLKLFEEHATTSQKHKTYKFWQVGNHAIELYSEKFVWEKINYIHNNPVKEGWVKNPEDWRYSSASNYQDMESTLEVEKIPQRLITFG